MSVQSKKVVVAPEHTETRGRVRVADLVIDKRVQREELSKARIDKIVAEFEPRVLGTIIVSKRANGTYIVLDGWHRSEACKLVPDGPEELEAIIHSGLSLPEEARLFRLYNARSPLRASDTFRAEVEEGAEEALRIAKIVEDFGMKVGHGSFAAVATARRIVHKRNGFKVFQDALGIIDKAFTLDSWSADSRVLGGIAELLDHYPELDQDHLVRRLRELGVGETDKDRGKGGVAVLVRRAKAYHESARPGSFAISMATVLVPIYNKNKQGDNRLAPYERRTRGAKLEAVEVEA